MNKDIATLPLVWQVLAYCLLGLGLLFVVGFILRYTTNLPWKIHEEGKHLVAMSANVGAFFVLYIGLGLFPEFPGRAAVRLGLLVALVANCGWRWVLLEKHLRERKPR